jgi:phage shock protein PspC (stress-responsive transcriptional regulator)
MNKVTTINLNGNAYQLEESGYETLRAYLDSAARNLGGNPDKDEIIADIEQAIADKFRALLGPNKTVVVTKEVEKVIDEMGPVQDATAGAGDPSAATSGAGGSGAQGAAPAPETAGAGHARRLYRIREGAMIAGVCNGLATYLNIDVSIVRILFVVLAVTWGFGLLMYILMMFLIPTATTSAEKTAAYGIPSTAEEFIRRAKEGYYEGMKAFRDKSHDRWARREWKRRFKQEARTWSREFRRGVHESAYQWRENWNQYWDQHPRFNVGMGLALPFLELFKVAVTLVFFYAVYALLVHGSFFGVHLPVGMPVWVGVIGLLILCNILTLPVKAMRHACYYHRGYWVGCFGALDSLVWIGIILFCVWYGNRHVPEVHEALKNVIPSLHHALDSLRLAWHTR